MIDTTDAVAADHLNDEPGTRDKKTLVLACGLAAVVMGGGAFFLLGGSDDAEATGAPTTTSSSSQRAKAAAAKAAAAAAVQAAAPAVVPAETSFNVGRNPFTALYVAPKKATAGTGATGTTAPVTKPGTAPTTTTPTTVTPVTGGTTYVPPVTPTAPKPAAPAVVLHDLELQSVSGGSGATKTVGTFVIDGKKYVVPVGQVFGPKKQLVVVAYQQDAKGVWTAVLRVGDSAPFDALQGDELKVM